MHANIFTRGHSMSHGTPRSAARPTRPALVTVSTALDPAWAQPRPSHVPSPLQSQPASDAARQPVFGHASVGRPAWTSTRDPESESVGYPGRDSDGGTRLRSR